MNRLAPLRRLVRVLDGQRIPLNSEQRSWMQGDIPYWGANGVVDHVDSFIFDEPLVLLGEDGAPFGDRTKDVAFHVRGKTWINNHIHVLRPNDDVDPRFLTYSLNSVDWSVFTTGATREKLTQDSMVAASVPYALLDEQRRIAAFLDTETARIDALIEAKQSLIRLITERYETSVQTVLSAFDWVPLRRMATRVDVGIAEAATHAYAESGVPLVRSTNIRAGFIDDGDLLYIEPWFAERNKSKYVFAGDILTVRTGNAGVSAVVPDRLHMSQVFTQLITTLGEHHSAEIVAFALNSPTGKDYFRTMQWGTAQNNISVPLLASCPVPFVPESEAAEVLTTLRTASMATTSSVDALSRQAGLLGEYRQALITAAVTGQLDEATLNDSRPVVDDVSVEVSG